MNIIKNNKINNWLNEGNRLERIWLLSQIEFKLRYYGNKLGLVWALLNPLSRIAMFYIMFVYIMNVNMENFAIYLFCAFLIWIYFTDITNRSIIILRSKQSLYEHTNIDKFEIYISLILSSTIGLIFNMALFVILSLFGGIYPTWDILIFPLIYLEVTILSLGIGLILSNLFLLFHDVNQFWNIITTALFFLSPILFRGEVVAQKAPIIEYLNPLSGIINNTRAILMQSGTMDWYMMLYGYGYALIILIIGVFLLKNISPRSSELV